MATPPKIQFETNTIELYEAIICVAIALATEIIGNGLLILIIVYEKFTMDPQKRTAINQLVSIACFIFLIHNMISIPILTYIIIVDDAGKSKKLKVNSIDESNFMFL